MSFGEAPTVVCKKTLATIDPLPPVCLPEARAGEKVHTPCPLHQFFKQDGDAKHVYAECQADGQWHPHVDYRACWSQVIGRHRILVDMYTVGYSLSLVSLVIAVVILVSFKRLHCTRNFIHVHLFVSGVLKAALLFLRDYFGDTRRDLTLWTHLCILSRHEISSYDPNMLTLSTHESQVGCKVANSMFHYATLAMYFWVLVEALYLHNLIFVSVFSEKKTLKWFVLMGWGVPMLFIAPWIAVKAVNDDGNDGNCWSDSAHPEYQWFYRGPISVTIVVNFLLFINIIRVLAEKLRGAATAGSHDSGGFRCCHWPDGISWRLAKSTLVLIPLFGVSGIIFVFMPPDIEGDAQDVRLSFDLFFNSFQGFFVAVLFCFLNGEVKGEFQKRWERWQMSRTLRHQSMRCSRLSSYQTRSTRSNSLALTQISCASPSNAPFLTPDQTPNSTALPKMAVTGGYIPLSDTATSTCTQGGQPSAHRIFQEDYSPAIPNDLTDIEESFVSTMFDQPCGNRTSQ
ncbi:PREDICTED: secretin receptor-like [Branchiostoma belcheri]|uniref:Secretin receptor-like n=1 Tax=Branchiostoma belcheri TaxID=7741 RepID=A0A6P4ZWP9_BRABE|nr:PREDICTED: secretin receptor-like [Branchiostoma belcheri]